MKLMLANESQNDELCSFFQQFNLPGLVELRLRRTDFFAPYRALSDKYRTYCLEDEEGKIQAIATFLIHDTLHEGHVQRVAIALDLRVAPNRAALSHWSQHFLPVLQQVYDEEKVAAVFSMINRTDPKLFNLFLRPRSMKRPLPRYYLYRKVNLVTLHGRYPWAPLPVPTLRIKNADTGQLDALINYLSTRAQYRTFATVWDFQSLQKKLHQMPGSTLSTFLIAQDARGNIVGCLAPWTSKEMQAYLPMTYSLTAHNFRQFLKFGSVFGWTRPLTKPKSRTGQDFALRFRYLTQIHARNEDIFESLLWTAYESLEKDEFAVYAHCDHDFRLRPPRHWVSSVQPHALYSVLPPSMEMPDFLNPGHPLNPEVEAPLLF